MFFGDYGGQYSAETLMTPLEELELAFEKIARSEAFRNELTEILNPTIGRPTPLTYLKNLTEHVGGAKIYAKREDLCHTGSHKLNNALSQALLAKKMGKYRIIAETGAGQHGVATATACAKLGLECTIYMGEKDAKRQAPNVSRIKLLGAKLSLVKEGQKTLKDAINAAMRDWVASVDTTHYLVGSAIGPHPFPTIVREFQNVIGREAFSQFMEIEQRLPSKLIACVGGGSNAIGLFYSFIDKPQVKLIGVQAGGQETGKHSSPLVTGRPGILHGTKTMLLQDEDGQILETHSIAPGLDYPAVGPEHAHLLNIGRTTYEAISDDQALRAFEILSTKEGIIPALESAHAVAATISHAKNMKPTESIIFNLSGRGDKDLECALDAIKKRGNK